VTVNAVCPGYVDTEMTTASVARVRERTGLSAEDALAAILKTAHQKRLITPEEVAFVVLTLCAEQAGGINGQAIVVDGGGLSHDIHRAQSRITRSAEGYSNGLLGSPGGRMLFVAGQVAWDAKQRSFRPISPSSSAKR